MNQLFKNLNLISYTTYYSDSHKFVMWKDEKRNIPIYSVKEIEEAEEKFDVFDSNDNMLASNLTEDKVVSFIGLDQGKIITKTTCPSKTEKIITEAAQRKGLSGGSFLRELVYGRQRVREKTSGVVKKKKTIDVSDLDLE